MQKKVMNNIRNIKVLDSIRQDKQKHDSVRYQKQKLTEKFKYCSSRQPPDSVLCMAKCVVDVARATLLGQYASQCRDSGKARGYKRAVGQCTRSSRMRCPTH